MREAFHAPFEPICCHVRHILVHRSPTGLLFGNIESFSKTPC